MRLLLVISNINIYPIFASVYKIPYSEYMNLPIDIFLSMMQNWQTIAGLNSGTEVFQIAIKECSNIINKPIVTFENKYNASLAVSSKNNKKATVDMIKRLTKKKVLNLSDVYNSLSTK